MNLASDISVLRPAAGPDWLLSPFRLNVAIAVSLVIHVVLLFGVNFKLPFTGKELSQPLEVVLVNSKSATKPRGADALAQANLDGGGNTDSNRQNKARSRPAASPDKGIAAAELRESTERVEQLEHEATRLMTATHGAAEVSQPVAEVSSQAEQAAPAHYTADARDLVQRGLEIARLEAQTSLDYEAYQKRPKRKFIGARTKEYRFARYVEDWRFKVERVGNLNYPEAARRDKLYGSLQLTVGIRSDGSLESVELNRSSGKKVLDEAAIRIVNLAGLDGFAPFPPEISRDTDILHITRTWVFTRSDELMSE
ncbi:MAG TPA: energy transducer TonB [Nitrosospira sp.]|nr:energy transducer TonB [Nitrosospira sp.]